MGKRRKQKRKILPIIITIAIVLLIGSFINIYRANPFNTNDNNGGWGNPLQLLRGKKERINILVFGVDSSKKQKSDISRSDSIMLVTIDPNKEKPTIISIPRDTRVQIPGRKNSDKINHAHAYGGPDLLVKTVEQFLNISINYYVRINYNAVIEVVDALGGVEIDVPINMKYSDPYDNPPLKIDIKKGLQVLDGQQAVHFMRFRKGYVNQDLGRIEAQQQFVKALVDKVISPTTILKIPQLVDIAYKNVETNIPKSKMLSLGAMASSINVDNLNKVTLHGVPKTINGTSYYVVNDEDIIELKNTYLTDEQSSSSIVTVEILNGCGVTGIAGQYADTVKEYGFDVSRVDNYEKNTIDVSFIEYAKAYKKEAENIKSELGINTLIEKDNNDEANIRIIIGKDLAR
ncbi:LCP family protein [Alkaliphilus sp. MSJ-5]|uniref:LCP family protein n=1 Tax=Alkaliphilus flagellatus TaxID=2841507 RepID=A0ABS6G5E8_9FIRM|nr:LCP family protein [Alkaliphilus flagellatus]MBU5677721.1 LCP family protein [Alkaliphilus flagellatus]